MRRKMEAMFVFSVFLLLFEICNASVPFIDQNLLDRNYSDGRLTTLQVIRKYGYPAEAHTIETADGYLLELHRIKPGKFSNNDRLNRTITNKYPVFFSHGISGSSGDFFIARPDSRLPFLLADMGFDIWFINSRGNSYSRAHVNITPDDKDFWDFSFHESGIYDIPRGIDFVLNYTKKDKVIFIGYSMGTTHYFVLASMLPQYNDKIKLSINMAPCVFFGNTRSPVVRLFSRIADFIKPFYDAAFKGELLPESNIFLYIRKIFCETTKPGAALCKNALSLVFGDDPVQFEDGILDSVLQRYPLGHSMKGLTHYTQLIKCGKFQQYDYGIFGNKKHYGSFRVPEYNLKNVRAPTFLYAGKNDILATVKDAQILANIVPSIEALRVIDYPSFTHLDFALAKDVKKLAYDLILDDLTNFLKANP